MRFVWYCEYMVYKSRKKGISNIMIASVGGNKVMATSGTGSRIFIDDSNQVIYNYRAFTKLV